MDILTIIFWIITAIALMISIIKSREKTWEAIKMGLSMMKGIIGQLIGVLFLIGLILTFIPPETISSYVNGSNVFVSTIIAALIGSLTLIPAFIGFPIVGSLVDAGISIIPAVAFLTTLTMVGFVTFPLENKEFGFKFALSRNILSFCFAVIISLMMGVIL